MSSIGIVGMGWVGSSVAISLLQRGAATELLVNDLNTDIAEGEAMDLDHGSLFYRSDATVRSASFEEVLERTDVFVLCAGRGGRGVETRLELLRHNYALAHKLGSALQGYRGIVVVVTNPVDVLTQVVAEASGLPPGRVLGTGTLLDTARLRRDLSTALDVHPRSIHAQVVGEHGDSSVFLWSGARVGGRALRDAPGWTTAKEDETGSRVRGAAQEITRRKGATNHAIGLASAQLIQAVLWHDRTVHTVTTVQTGTAGMDGIALSLPTVLGREGALSVIEPDMDDAEWAGLLRSSEILRKAYEEASGG